MVERSISIEQVGRSMLSTSTFFASWYTASTNTRRCRGRCCYKYCGVVVLRAHPSFSTLWSFCFGGNSSASSFERVRTDRLEMDQYHACIMGLCFMRTMVDHGDIELSWPGVGERQPKVH